MNSYLLSFFTFLLISNFTKSFAQGDFIWAKDINSNGNNVGIGDLFIDDKSNINLVGSFEGSLSFGASTLTSNGLTDIFIAKLDSNGNVLFAKKFGGNLHDGGQNISHLSLLVQNRYFRNFM